MGFDALARLSEEEGKCWAFGESRRVVPAEVAREVVSAIQAERDDLAARLAELEGQEPTAWMNAKRDMASFIHFHEDDLPLFARPVPVEPVNVDFGMRGENMFFQIGNQSFLLDYKPEEPGEFEFMKAMLLSAFSRITHGVKTESQPVNARILDALKRAKDSLVAFKFVPEHANCWEASDEENLTAVNSAISAAEAQQEHLLQDMHDAGREIDRVMAECFLTDWEKEQIHRQAESDAFNDLLGSLKEVCETFSSTNRLWKDTAVHVMAQRSVARAEAVLSSSDDTPPSAEERRLRRMLCLHRHGASAYMDDGEATFGGDEFQRPTDYLRESLDSIEQAWIEAGLKQVAQAEPRPDADGWIPWAGGADRIKARGQK